MFRTNSNRCTQQMTVLVAISFHVDTAAVTAAHIEKPCWPGGRPLNRTLHSDGFPGPTNCTLRVTSRLRFSEQD